ncbi:hypothetical protein [Azospirillum tabaci]|uniref:hypothetical protein n=1 Tax=Azospirillum tabaci TaxID=2752310 RepID=UPI0016608FE5|nr:hypothetical protein [Azospirillum tabaci]
MHHRALDPVTALTMARPLGARAAALDMAEQVRRAVAEKLVPVVTIKPGDLAAATAKLEAMARARRSGTAKRRVSANTRAAISAAGRRKKADG